MELPTINNYKTDIRAWAAFLFGAFTCILLLTWFEIGGQPSGILTFEVSTTKPGNLNVLYSKNGTLIDPGWSVNLAKENTSQIVQFPLIPGRYDLIGFKPLIGTEGLVSIKHLRIISDSRSRDIEPSRFVRINQLGKISVTDGVAVFGPAQGATDPFGIYPELGEVVPEPLNMLEPILMSVTGKLALLILFIAVMYGLVGSLPFSVSNNVQKNSEPGPSQWIGFLAVGLILLYLRNAHSLIVPILYTEDGAWGADLINRGFFDMLIHAKEVPDRYFVFGNILLLAFAQASNYLFFGHNLTYLPHFVSLFSMLFYSVLALAPIILLRDVLRLEARLLLWMFILFVPLGDSSFEVLGRISNIGFSFLFITFCLLIWRHFSLVGASAKHIIATDAMLFLSANTNPLCYLLIAVAFSVEAWGNWRSNIQVNIKTWLLDYCKDTRVKSSLVLLIFFVVFGTWMLLLEKNIYSDFLTGELSPGNLIEAVVARIFLFPLVFMFYSTLNDVFSVIILIVVSVISLKIIARSQLEKKIFMYCAFVIIAATAITLWSRPGLTQMLSNYTTTVPDRYYFGLSLFIFFLIVTVLSAIFRQTVGGWQLVSANMITGILVALYAGNSKYFFEFEEPRWPNIPQASFRERVMEAYLKGGVPGPNGVRYSVALHPSPWVIHFPKENVLATVLGVKMLPESLSSISNLDQNNIEDIAQRYDGKVVRQKSADRGREDGWFYVTAGKRSWIPDGNWLKKKKLSQSDIIEISSKEFGAIEDSGNTVK